MATSDEPSRRDTESRRESGRRSDEGAVKSLSDRNQSLCAFWLGERCFALDTPLVGEVVTVEDKISVPLSPPAVRGIFNLRGEPVPLVSLSELLGIASSDRRASKSTTAIVVRSAEIVAGLIADRMEAVIPAGRARLAPASAEEDQAVIGFLELAQGEWTTVVSVLDPTVVIERLSALRFLKQAAVSV